MIEAVLIKPKKVCASKAADTFFILPGFENLKSTIETRNFSCFFGVIFAFEMQSSLSFILAKNFD